MTEPCFSGTLVSLSESLRAMAVSSTTTFFGSSVVISSISLALSCSCSCLLFSFHLNNPHGGSWPDFISAISSQIPFSLSSLREIHPRPWMRKLDKVKISRPCEVIRIYVRFIFEDFRHVGQGVRISGRPMIKGGGSRGSSNHRSTHVLS